MRFRRESGNIAAGRSSTEEFGSLLNAFGSKLTLVDPDKVTAAIVSDDIGKHDIVASWSQFNFSGLKSVTIGDHGEYVMSDSAFEQLCHRLQVPSAYLKKCPFNGKAGRQEQLEYWRDQTEDREILLRVKNYEKEDSEGVQGTLRAVLAKSYEAIDNHRIWSWTQDVMERARMALLYAKVSEASTHFRLVFPDAINIGTEQQPDPHYFGIHVADSEIGGRALTIDYMLFRVACQNGLIVEPEGDKLLWQKHIHVDHVSLAREFNKAVDTALEHRATVIDSLESSRSTVVKDPHSMIRRIVRHYKGSKEFAEKIIAAYEQEQPAGGQSPTRFHVVQAFTRAARKFPMDDRQQLESMAGAWLLEAA